MEAMNWKQIKESYPKSWEAFENWQDNRYDLSYEIMPNEQLVDSDLNNFNTRDLYDFFDSYTILGFIRPQYVTDYSATPEKVTMYYDWHILGHEKRRSGFSSEPLPATRKEAEDILFPKEFAILESLLTT